MPNFFKVFKCQTFDPHNPSSKKNRKKKSILVDLLASNIYVCVFNFLMMSIATNASGNGNLMRV